MRANGDMRASASQLPTLHAGRVPSLIARRDLPSSLLLLLFPLSSLPDTQFPMGDVEPLSATYDALPEPQQLSSMSDSKELDSTLSPSSTAHSVNTGDDTETQDEIVEVWNNADAVKVSPENQARDIKAHSATEIHEEHGEDAKLVASPVEHTDFNPAPTHDGPVEPRGLSIRPESTVSPLPSMTTTSPPASPTASTSTSFAATQAEASSSRTNLRAPTPTQRPQSSSSSLDRRQSRRRSTLGDVRPFLSPHFISC